ncbi:MAG: hypothetical protein ACKV2Q_32325 [Planctomycetaceae bacterium]
MDGLVNSARAIGQRWLNLFGLIRREQEQHFDIRVEAIHIDVHLPVLSRRWTQFFRLQIVSGSNGQNLKRGLVVIRKCFNGSANIRDIQERERPGNDRQLAISPSENPSEPASNSSRTPVGPRNEQQNHRTNAAENPFTSVR